jgi:hypothetical protein
VVIIVAVGRKDVAGGVDRVRIAPNRHGQVERRRNSFGAALM